MKFYGSTVGSNDSGYSCSNQIIKLSIVQVWSLFDLLRTVWFTVWCLANLYLICLVLMEKHILASEELLKRNTKSSMPFLREKTLQGKGCSACYLVSLSVCGCLIQRLIVLEKWPWLLVWTDALSSPSLIAAGPRSPVCCLDSVPVNLKSSPCGPAVKCDGQQLHLKAHCVRVHVRVCVCG